VTKTEVCRTATGHVWQIRVSSLVYRHAVRNRKRSAVRHPSSLETRRCSFQTHSEYAFYGTAKSKINAECAVKVINIPSAQGCRDVSHSSQPAAQADVIMLRMIWVQLSYSWSPGTSVNAAARLPLRHRVQTGSGSHPLPNQWVKGKVKKLSLCFSATEHHTMKA
jgi:hypothetical protein